MKTNQKTGEGAAGSLALCIIGEQKLRMISAECVRDRVVSRFVQTIRIPHRLKKKIWRLERKLLAVEGRGRSSCRGEGQAS